MKNIFLIIFTISSLASFAQPASILTRNRQSLDSSTILAPGYAKININTDAIVTKWGNTGNSGLSGSNFIGTTDNIPFNIKVNNVRVAAWDTSASTLNIGNKLSTYTIAQSKIRVYDSAVVSDGDYRYGLSLGPEYGKVGGTYSSGLLAAMQAEVRFSGWNTASYSSFYPAVAARFSYYIAPGATGTQLQAARVHAVSDIAGMTTTWLSGVQIDNPVKSGTAVVTNNIGLQIKAQTAGTNNFGILDSAYNNRIIGGTLPDLVPALFISGTSATTMTATTNVNDIQITGAGSSSFSLRALNVDLNAGYTGATPNYAGRFNNASAGTGVFTITGGAANYGVQVGSTATTTGSNVNMGFASGGNLNIGLYGRATGVKNSAVNMNLFAARNSATSGIGIAGYFTQDTAALSTATAATVIIDNGNQANALLLVRDAGILKFSIADGGNPTLALGNKLVIGEGSNASIGISGAMTAGTITISTTAVATGSRIFLTPVGAGTGEISLGTIVNGTSFVINSSDNTDTRTVQWFIVN